MQLLKTDWSDSTDYALIVISFSTSLNHALNLQLSHLVSVVLKKLKVEGTILDKN